MKAKQKVSIPLWFDLDYVKKLELKFVTEVSIPLWFDLDESKGFFIE